MSIDCNIISARESTKINSLPFLNLHKALQKHVYIHEIVYVIYTTTSTTASWYWRGFKKLPRSHLDNLVFLSTWVGTIYMICRAIINFMFLAPGIQPLFVLHKLIIDLKCYVFITFVKEIITAYHHFSTEICPTSLYSFSPQAKLFHIFWHFMKSQKLTLSTGIFNGN